MRKLRSKARKASGSEKERLTKEIEALEDSIPSPPATIPAIWNDRAHRTPIHVLKRGVWENKGEPVGARPPSVLVPDDLAEGFAARLRRETDGVPSQVIHRAYLLAIGRPPTPREEAVALEFLRDGPLEEFALALFNLNGFLYVP